MYRISHIICTFNRAPFLKKALKALSLQTYPHLSEMEIVIIDNNSTDDTHTVVQDFIKEFPKLAVTYAKEEKQGLSNARNKGIEVSKGEWLAFLDDDAHIHADYTTQVLDFIMENSNVKAIGGPILLDFESEPPRWYTNYLGSLFGYFIPYNETMAFTKKSYPRGSNMIFHRSLFDTYGVFNPKLGRSGGDMMGSEEKDIFQRIYEGDEHVYYLHTAIMYHLVPDFRTTQEFIKKQAIGVGMSEHIRIMQSQKGIFKKFIGELVKWGASFLLFVFYLFRFAPSKGIMLIKFRYWVLKGLTKTPGK